MRNKTAGLRTLGTLANCLALAVLINAAGCQMPGQPSTYATDTANPFDESKADKPVIETVSATEPVASAAAEPDLASVLKELDEIGEIDPLAREKITNDLRGVKPELWPLMVEQFKSAMAFRKQLAEKESEPLQTAATVRDIPEPRPAVQVVPASLSIEKQTGNTTAIEQAPVTPVQTQPPLPEPIVVSDTSPPTAKVVPASLYNHSQPLPPPPVTTAARTDTAMQSDTMVRPVSYTATPAKSIDWKEHLNSAIQQLERTVPTNPASTSELHEHVQLRMMYLLAGQRGEAMLPIPGASPALQDYWSKQLFAIATHLDHQQQPDDKRRAASSLIHLDQARAKLAELATLQIRNLSFVDSVDGYGTYEAHASREFHAGDPVTLYAEVENLRSESTAEGYRSSLSTSYEVVDASGQRVDGRQFPDVADLCQNPRRDFHMQYGVSLPTRIYPGEYQLRLTITDQLSHKIGQASVPFVIVE